MKSILIKKLPLYIFLITIVFLSLIIYHLEDTAPQARLEIQQATAPIIQNNRTIEQVRLNDYKLIRPLLMTEILSESQSLMGLKRDLDSEINQLKLNGTINDASVYVRRLNDGEWISVNSTAEY